MKLFLCHYLKINFVVASKLPSGIPYFCSPNSWEYSEIRILLNSAWSTVGCFYLTLHFGLNEISTFVLIKQVFPEWGARGKNVEIGDINQNELLCSHTFDHTNPENTLCLLALCIGFILNGKDAELIEKTTLLFNNIKTEKSHHCFIVFIHRLVHRNIKPNCCSLGK